MIWSLAEDKGIFPFHAIMEAVRDFVSKSFLSYPERLLVVSSRCHILRTLFVHCRVVIWLDLQSLGAVIKNDSLAEKNLQCATYFHCVQTEEWPKKGGSSQS